MMHPLNNRYFGPQVGKIRIRFHNGSSVVDGYIVKQLGLTKYRVSDGTTTKDIVLSSAIPSGNLGRINITVNGQTQYVTKLASKLVQTSTGLVDKWVSKIELIGNITLSDTTVLSASDHANRNILITNDNAYTMNIVLPAPTGNTNVYSFKILTAPINFVIFYASDYSTLTGSASTTSDTNVVTSFIPSGRNTVVVDGNQRGGLAGDTLVFTDVGDHYDVALILHSAGISQIPFDYD